MQVTRYSTADEFYQRAAAFLLEHEAINNVILGIITTLQQRPDYYLDVVLLTVDEGEAVLFAVVMTPPFGPVLSACEVPVAVELAAEDLVRTHPNLPGVNGPKDRSNIFAVHWQQLTGQRYRLQIAERIYQLEAVQPVIGVSGALRRATPADRDLLLAWIAAFEEEALGITDRSDNGRWVDERLTFVVSGIYLWEDNGAATLAGYAGPTPHGIRIGPVYTPPMRRGNGYASACVAALSQLLLDGGRRFCFLYTDLANPTSNHIYQAIGYMPIVDIDVYRFEEA